MPFRNLYTKNDSFWSSPNILNSYFAGFIAADGCVDDKRNQLSIHIKESDKIVLERLKSAIQYTGPIRNKISKYNHHSVILSVGSSRKYIQDLQKWYSITPRKTKTLQPPNITNINHIKAYIIGYFDGDGSISWNKFNNYYQISILGTRELLCWIKHILLELTDDNYALRFDRGIYRIDKNGSAVRRFMNVLSDINVPRLDRKWL